MKTLKVLTTAVAIASMMSACLDGENRNAGFPGGVGITLPYANDTLGYISFASFGDWRMTQSSGSDWCSISRNEGEGYVIYTLPVSLKQNTTGSSRSAAFRVVDVNENDAYVNFTIYQYATRGNGALGNAALVESVSGDDGSKITVTYDELCRPLSLLMEKNEEQLYNLSMRYTNNDSTMYVNTGTTTLKAKYSGGYQPDKLCSATDTVGYYPQNTISTNRYAFNIEDHRAGGEYIVQALLLVGQNLNPDSEHVADSLRYLHVYSDGTRFTEWMKLSYSENDNRCQSLDVNQLILGIEECNPYTLLSLYRYARNSKIISEAVTDDGKYTVETVLNANKSVRTMTVTDKAGKKITYTFSYL